MDNSQPVVLTDVEVSELGKHETVIERGLKTFVDVGNALLAIRDGRLYRADFGTFEEYCKERWGIERRRAYQLMDAASTVNNVKNFSHEPPRTESHAAPLAQIEPEKQPEVWQQIVDTAPNGKVTGKHARTVVDEYTQPKSPATNGHAPPSSYEEQAGDLQGDADDWEDEEEPEQPFDPPIEQKILEDTAPHSEAAHNKMAVHFSSETPEHYTPIEVIDAAIACMGKIDLDPCSNSAEAPNVPAKHHFTAADDGLSRPWFGRVYMNPPYGREIAKWIEKLCDEYKNGVTEEAIALVPSRTDTQWWRQLRDYPVCLVEGRLKFLGNDEVAPFPSAVFYLGNDIGRFYHSFGELGDIWQRIEPRMYGD